MISEPYQSINRTWRYNMNRYIDALNCASDANSNLADKLTEQRAQPLSEMEKETIRAAVVPIVRQHLRELLRHFAIGNDPFECPEFKELTQMFNDLKGK